MNTVTIREGMQLNKGERVEVYYNIHKGGFSIKSLDKTNPNKGKVVAYAPHVYLQSCSFHVSDSKHKWILDNQRKAVYAVVRGFLVDMFEEKPNTNDLNEIYINPYKCKEFTDVKTNKVVEKANIVIFSDKACYYN
ncbi:hypothetical protein Slash_109 [Bacillus phage Slash]|uniref:Uncharacterized protein n=1 Tax=Bacillus phage Slash TaxID=1406790 RepID=U5Q0I8_9CAUD|nr:hypothetical protein Slash_109 [Bacillus phage Slash]AGY48398.1 hypothetical protein Slash_109 [Bacillus phage Slash]